MKISITSYSGLNPGDHVELQQRRLSRIISLLTHPRLLVVKEVTGTTFSLEEMRMTWGEWIYAVRRALFK